MIKVRQLSLLAHLSQYLYQDLPKFQLQEIT